LICIFLKKFKTTWLDSSLKGAWIFYFLIYIASRFVFSSFLLPSLSYNTHTHTHTHTVMDSLLGQEFKTIKIARDMINKTIIDAGFSYKKYKSTQACYILVCKDKDCKFFFYIFIIVVYTNFNRHISYSSILSKTFWDYSNYDLYSSYLLFYDSFGFSSFKFCLLRTISPYRCYITWSNA
jgi:hypothetical protein